MHNLENVPPCSESSVYTNASCRDKRMDTKQRKYSVPPVTLGNDAQRKVWWNYWEARSWQHRHQVACWRSQVEALQYENQMLHEYIKVLLTGNPESAPPNIDIFTEGRFSSPTPSLRSKRNRKRNTRRKRKAKNKYQSSNESDESEVCSEIDEELLDYVEETIRHRLERDNHPLLEKHREKNEDQKMDAECLLEPEETRVRNRLEDMQLQFGSAAPKLLAMETAMQLTFNSNCDRHHPRLWPVLPLAATPK